MSATISPVTPSTRPATEVPARRVPVLWVGFVVASLLALDVLDQTVWTIAVPLAAGALWLFISLLIGAFVASFFATWGGRHRDD